MVLRHLLHIKAWRLSFAFCVLPSVHRLRRSTWASRVHILHLRDPTGQRSCWGLLLVAELWSKDAKIAFCMPLTSAFFTDDANLRRAVLRRLATWFTHTSFCSSTSLCDHESGGQRHGSPKTRRHTSDISGP